jgi:hypothetical protein
MELNTGIPVLRKFMLKNLQKIPIGEGQVQDSIPALPGQLPRCRNVEKIGNRRTDGQRNDFNRAHFFKNVL